MESSLSFSEALDVIKEEQMMPEQRTRNKREVPFTHDEKRIAGVSRSRYTNLRNDLINVREKMTTVSNEVKS